MPVTTLPTTTLLLGLTLAVDPIAPATAAPNADQARSIQHSGRH